MCLSCAAEDILLIFCRPAAFKEVLNKGGFSRTGPGSFRTGVGLNKPDFFTSYCWAQRQVSKAGGATGAFNANAAAFALAGGISVAVVGRGMHRDSQVVFNNTARVINGRKATGVVVYFNTLIVHIRPRTVHKKRLKTTDVGQEGIKQLTVLLKSRVEFVRCLKATHDGVANDILYDVLHFSPEHLSTRLRSDFVTLCELSACSFLPIQRPAGAPVAVDSLLDLEHALNCRYPRDKLLLGRVADGGGLFFEEVIKADLVELPFFDKDASSLRFGSGEGASRSGIRKDSNVRGKAR
ncbi:uncharacterized protein BDZ99DRAFT_479612 [Mytilinidion resinicola]|uniref:Uncharacterized protein n=1 Tax=Mytilinidion resinicola TaxID=574789 RepID=A0A6A6YC04_9PEZI|nr:uncharacterized protein BDZ99DRAFT_479612 [Mytilinidion resinicola]KAF2806351.1 hypothetical protein BDZ99DRAFT_479612 [Mytilinidion resinicola]